jgi:hypothetical protein
MGKWQSNSDSFGKHFNLKTLASLLELSQTTISLVLNDSPAAQSILEILFEPQLIAANRPRGQPRCEALSTTACEADPFAEPYPLICRLAS